MRLITDDGFRRTVVSGSTPPPILSLKAITFVKVKVANMASPKRSRRYEFLVDSGAVYTVVPENELKKLGIKPTSEEEFTLANGETFKKAVGNALFEFEGKVRAAPVIFGDRGIFILGATTLEALGSSQQQ